MPDKLILIRHFLTKYYFSQSITWERLPGIKPILFFTHSSKVAPVLGKYYSKNGVMKENFSFFRLGTLIDFEYVLKHTFHI